MWYSRELVGGLVLLVLFLLVVGLCFAAWGHSMAGGDLLRL